MTTVIIKVTQYYKRPSEVFCYTLSDVHFSPLKRIEIVPMQYGKGSDPDADLFWESLAHKTWSHRLEVEEPEDLRVVIKAAIFRGRGIESLQVNITNKHIATLRKSRHKPRPSFCP